MEFKQLEIKPKYSWLKRNLKSKQNRKSALFIAIGAIVGISFFYITQGKYLDVISSGQIIKSMLVGGFFGFFVTNSPCARGRC